MLVDRGDAGARQLVNSACSKNMTEQCMSILKSHPGEYDALAGAYCESNPDIPFCSCYATLPADAPAELKVLSSKPQCWGFCNISGYKNTNLKNDQSPCGNITICNQNINQMENTSKINMNNIIRQDCSTKAPPTQPQYQSQPEQQNYVYMLIAFIMVLIAAIVQQYLTKNKSGGNVHPHTSEDYSTSVHAMM